MRNIINNQRARSSNSRRPRENFIINNGYNRLQSTPNNSNTIPQIENDVSINSENIIPEDEDEELESELSNIIHYQLFSTDINVYVNNLTSELENNFNPNPYYSTFEYESFNIRFFHNEVLNPENINNHIDNVIHNINEIEVQNILNNIEESQDSQSQSQRENTPEIINKIEESTLHDKYKKHALTLKNCTCPVLLKDFEDDDIVSIFILCNHAIDKSTYDRYVKTFTKCPLCNNKLFEL